MKTTFGKLIEKGVLQFVAGASKRVAQKVTKLTTFNYILMALIGLAASNTIEEAVASIPADRRASIRSMVEKMWAYFEHEERYPRLGLTGRLVGALQNMVRVAINATGLTREQREVFGGVAIEEIAQFLSTAATTTVEIDGITFAASDFATLVMASGSTDGNALGTILLMGEGINASTLAQIAPSLYTEGGLSAGIGREVATLTHATNGRAHAEST